MDLLRAQACRHMIGNAGLAPDARPAPHPEVHVGRDGWLFLTGGSNGALGQFERSGFPRRLLWDWRKLLSWRQRCCTRLGATYLHVVAPEKLTILPEATQDLSFDPERAPALRLRRWLRASPASRALVDLVGPLRAARNGAPLYLRTDTHWTFEGGVVAYRAICRALGIAPREDIAQRRILGRHDFSGDLARKIQPAPIESAESCRFRSQARRVHANDYLKAFEASGRVTEVHLGAHVIFENPDPNADPRRLVVFGDSYAHFMPLNVVATLTPLLADRFREVHFLWSPSIDWVYLDAIRPDIVMTEIAERFMIEVPPRKCRIETLAEIAMRSKSSI